MVPRKPTPSHLYVRIASREPTIKSWHEAGTTYAEVALTLAIGGAGARPSGGGTGPSNLTPREAEVATWVARGKTYGEVALVLSISADTAKAHIESVCHKLNAVNKTHAVAVALTQGLIKV